jgi:hypothetical protein
VHEAALTVRVCGVCGETEVVIAAATLPTGTPQHEERR